ncbi:hypothetical protein [Corynebacterium wankanglinii]|uniref:Uncharacterized protein n=1 Tax=Corynebacterium wankanglinii TaxID=2735136 RepID=A0A838CFZ3_9CORY|nr:hypothetical protein [Corynebacterium wankanglinii]MBA1834141.1 hypothetical protein [Corynebacterium wankanglinii]
MPQINAELYARRHADKAASQLVVKVVTAWLAGFTTASVAFGLIGLWVLGAV